MTKINEYIYVSSQFKPSLGYQKLGMSILLKFAQKWKLTDEESMWFVGAPNMELYRKWKVHVINIQQINLEFSVQILIQKS